MPHQNVSGVTPGKPCCTEPRAGVVVCVCVWGCGEMGWRGSRAGKEPGFWMVGGLAVQWQRRGSREGLERPEEKMNCNLQAAFQP